MKNKSLVLLSGEGTTVPLAEAKALFHAYDSSSTFETPEPRVLIADSLADPFLIASRVAFSRRVGRLIEEPRQVAGLLRGKSVRVRNFDLREHPPMRPETLLNGIDCQVDLHHPEFEFSLVRGEKVYLALTRPAEMVQGWSSRRPRVRPYFHPSAIFPKLSRAIVNLSRCKAEDIFLDPFSGTGSLLLEAALSGARPVGMDIMEKMTSGSILNMRKFGQEWVGVIRADAFHSPVLGVDAIATDIPYGRASSTRGRRTGDILQMVFETIPHYLRSGSRAVIMHPQSMKVSESSSLAVEEEHDLYVHKLLTRTITILRRR